ncbi:uncharacterized protein MONBRDRAFT_32743 [Monosiga brevicollis MX1]|uniref:Uncharacterized protein n=1 Tax=Monosiga brevicollis TaxID=81824 RepID=A9V1F6_MONBE|nr:uncharacterized protein MONBRDRAFT_32743 [Monosiga brevicollis MX1]EDQ88558.1 predicted protein [Monosiga brevicollis MX1]|eukprot:XP_001746662.1 hypothetical protein [Monosiga brevicollis MX1]
MSTSSNADYGLAFGVTAGSGMATLLGSAVVFFPSFYKPIVLGVSLALAAGVMIYVSFVEIFFKGLDEFEAYFDDQEGVNRSLVSVEAYEAPAKAYYTATATFFAGIVLTFLLDIFIHWLYQFQAEDSATVSDRANQHSPTGEQDAASLQETTACDLERAATRNSRTPSSSTRRGRAASNGCDTNVEIVANYRHADHARSTLLELQHREEDRLRRQPHHPEQVLIERRDSGVNLHGSQEIQQNSAKKLVFMALITGTAIALHNFPEGLATFVATARDPSVGAPLGVAIAIHNIPEGICVAVPIYFATNSSLVSGMMVYISFRELIPTALSYDSEGKHTVPALFFGMCLMAASLMLFKG